jgi:hypothetical protein
VAALDQKAIIGQIDSVLAERDVLLSNIDHVPNSVERYAQVIVLLLAAINRLSPVGSTYVVNAKAYEEQYIGGRTAFMAIEPLTGILRALRSDYASGHLQSIVELIHADIFADFFDMAEYLLEQGYKDPAAVIVGSVLEEHLRKLCNKVGIATLQAGGTPKKADSLNSELAGASVYSKLDQKSVTAWLDLRNKAAHGKYVEYTKEQVSLMLQSVRDFSARHPA